MCKCFLLSNLIFITIVLGKPIPPPKNKTKQKRQDAKFEAQPWLTNAEFDNGSLRVKCVCVRHESSVCDWHTWACSQRLRGPRFLPHKRKSPGPQLNSRDFMYGNGENLTPFYLLERVYSVNAVTRVCFVFERKWHTVVSFHSLP